METSVAPMRGDDVDPAVEALVRAFQEDPGFRHVWPDATRRARALHPFLKMALVDALPFGHVGVAWQDGRVVGAAAWLPPGTHPMSTARHIRAMPGLGRVVASAPGSMRTLMRLGRALEEAFPEQPTWYLEVVGVAPDAARQGVGTRLLEAELDAADNEGRHCYLETNTEHNVRWYERLGFTVLREGWDVFGEGGPTYWAMSRP